MNYELKSIRPGSVFFNAARLFLVVGFLAAVYTFFISPYATVRFSFRAKAVMTLLFTGAYGGVVSAILYAVAHLYNLWVRDFEFKYFLWSAAYIFSGIGLLLGFIHNFGFPSDRGLFMKLLGTGLYAVVFGALVALGVTLLTGLFHSWFGPFKGITIHLEPEPGNSETQE
jgi:hypothetical protein